MAPLVDTLRGTARGLSQRQVLLHLGAAHVVLALALLPRVWNVPVIGDEAQYVDGAKALGNLLRDWGALRSPNTFAKLATIATRTLVIAADADLLAPPGLMRIWARHVKDAQWTTVPDAGHSIAWEQPAIFNDIVLRFLKGGRPFGNVP